MCSVILIASVLTISCPVRPSPQEAAAVLANSPALSNRTHVYTPSAEEQRRPRVVLVPPAVQKPTVPEQPSETGRAIRMGIPGGWTPLEWAILHSEGRK